MAFQPGDNLNNGKYTIERELGKGRFGVTYLAKSNGKDVAIKTLNEDLLNQLNQTERDNLESKFADEARKLERCKHPRIVSVYEIFKERQLFCIAMEYIPGTTLGSLIQRILPEKEALAYICQIGEALIEVHRQGLLHRDVKPDNIMVRAGKNEVVLIDFGLAQGFDHPLTTKWRDNNFTPPELNSTKRERGAYTDVYSLAATLYVLLTGQLPISALDRKLNNQELTPPKQINPDISERTNQAIINGMMLDSNARPQTVEKWLDSLGLRRSLPSLPKTDAKTILKALTAIITLVAAIVTVIAYFKPPSPSPVEPSPSAKPSVQSRAYD